MKKILSLIMCLFGQHKNKEILRVGFNLFAFAPNEYAHQCQKCGRIEAFSNGYLSEEKFDSVDEVIAWSASLELKRSNFMKKVKNGVVANLHPDSV